MKYLCFLLAPVLCAQIVRAEAAAVSTNSLSGEYSVSERGANYREWQRVTWTTNESGQIQSVTNSYTELETGMHFLENGEWKESKAEIRLDPKGAVADQGRTKVMFAPNINSAGAMDLTTADGKRFRSRVLGLSYFDTATGQSVLIAEVKDCIGELSPPNQVFYSDAFTDFKTEIRYVYLKAGLEQFVTLREQPPSPKDYGLNPATTRLQVLTEFFDPPIPRKEQANIDNMQVDRLLDFGEMKIGSGKAFAEGENEKSIRVDKHWQKLDGRDFLVEEVKYTSIEPALEQLPLRAQTAIKPKASPDSVRHVVSNERLLPEKTVAKASVSKPIQIARVSPRAEGFVIDYALLASQTNFTFRGDTTYYVTNGVILSGTTVVEGGAVIKAATNLSAQIQINGPIKCETFPYRPVVFTSKNDNSVGETISGSTGNPDTNYCAAPMLYFLNGGCKTDLKYLRIAHAWEGLEFDNYPTTNSLTDVQMVNCRLGASFLGVGDVFYRNVLLCNVLTNFSGGGATIRGEHVTVNRSSLLIEDYGMAIRLTNSLLVAVTNLGLTDYNATNSNFIWLTNDPGIFQTVDGGSCYLTNNSPYRNVGTTNIKSNLLAELKNKTTYPPVVYSNVTFVADTTLSPQAQRETDTPDLGYHYDPIDYTANMATVSSGVSLVLTNGVRLGAFGTHGIVLNSGAHFISEGKPELRNKLFYNNSVQENAKTLGNPTGIIQVNSSTSSEFRMRFSDASFLSDVSPRRKIISGDSGFVNLRDCEFFDMFFVLESGTAEANPTGYCKNCLFERCQTSVASVESEKDGTFAMYAQMYNNLFWNGSILFLQDVAIGSNDWTVINNVFDGTAVSAFTLSMANHHNGYVNATNLPGSSGSDKTLTNFVYDTGPLGRFYQNSTNLIDAGSLSATNWGLYHFTTRTNQAKETNSLVDMGFHFIAVDTNGIPFDADNDGEPDYLEDGDGKGNINTGETDWNNASDLGLKVVITQPQHNATLP